MTLQKSDLSVGFAARRFGGERVASEEIRFGEDLHFRAIEGAIDET
jgi:hypothetical protein